VIAPHGNGTQAAATPVAAVAAAPEPPPAPVAAQGLDGLRALWPAVLASLAETNQLLSLCLADARPVTLEDDELVIAFEQTSAFMRRKAEDAPNRLALAETIRALTGIRARLSFELRDAVVVAAGPVEAVAAGGDELIARFKAEFDAEEIDPDKREDPS
jgi:DNA polymerase-3 subunit gamma/tau